MSCSTLSNIRKSCSTIIGGITQVQIRDWDSLAYLPYITILDWVGSGLNLWSSQRFNAGTYTGFLYNNTTSILSTIEVVVHVTSGDNIDTINIIDGNQDYVTFGLGDTFSLPFMQPHFIFTGTAYVPDEIPIASTSPSAHKFGLNQYNEINIIGSRSVNDFGETIDPSWFEIQVTKQGGKFDSIKNDDLATGNTAYTNTLTVTLNNVSNTVDDFNILTQGQRKLLVQFADTNSVNWLFGLDTGAVVTKIDKKTGAKIGDPNNYEITFEAKEGISEYVNIY